MIPNELSRPGGNKRFFHVEWKLSPSGVMAPMPVTTTRLLWEDNALEIILSNAQFILSLLPVPAFSQIAAVTQIIKLFCLSLLWLRTINKNYHYVVTVVINTVVGCF